MNSEVRRSRLKGTREADRILKILDVRPRLLATHERVDVFDALAWLDVTVMFRPLRGLLGAYLRGDRPGALISTQRQLSVQRFTAAHELGHAVLNHEPSLDSPDVLRRAALNTPTKKIAGFASYLQEIEADAFAGAFLLPIWLVTHHARKQGWSRTALTQEVTVYQLSLRCGASFQATVWALERHQFISQDDRVRLLGVKPKTVKALLGHQEPVAKTRADAWLLTKGDAGSDIAVVVGDTITTTLDQNAGAGFLWKNINETPKALSFISEETDVPFGLIGARTTKHELYRADEAGGVSLRYQHKRPWEEEAIDHAAFNLLIHNPESGLSRANRRRMIVSADQGHHAN